jgi:hypothetical protein
MTGLIPLDAGFPIDRSTAPCPEFWRPLRLWETYPSPAAQAFATLDAS